jgi:hypothetical protein
MSLSQTPDCASTLLDAATPMTATTLTYAATTTTQIATGWSDGLMQNQYLADCGAITSCSLFNSDFTTALTGVDATYVTMGAADPWPLSALRSVTAGWTITICYKC